MIGGSTAAAACGLDPFKSRVALWLELTGRVEREPAGEWAEWGTLLQPLIAQVVEQHGYATMPAPVETLQHPEHAWMTGHPDGYATLNGGASEDGRSGAPPLNGRGLLEIKTAGLRMERLWADEETPIPYVLQVQHYLALTGLDWALVACLIGGQRLALRVLPRDDALIAHLIEREAELVGYVERDEQPPADGSASTDAMLKLLYPSADGEPVLLTADDAAIVEEAKNIKRSIKASEQALALAEQTIKQRLGASPAGVYEGRVLARWPTVRSRRLSTERFKTEYPDLYESLREEHEYRRFTLS